MGITAGTRAGIREVLPSRSSPSCATGAWAMPSSSSRDGLKGVIDPVHTVCVLATVQTCIIHLTSDSFCCASRK